MQLVLKGLSLLLTVALPVALVLVAAAVTCGLAAWHHRRRRAAAAIPKPRIEFVGFDHGLPFVEAADLEACAAAPPAPQTPRDTLRDLRVLGY